MLLDAWSSALPGALGQHHIDVLPATACAAMQSCCSNLVAMIIPDVSTETAWCTHLVYFVQYSTQQMHG